MKSPFACLLLMAAFLANSRDAAAQSTYGFKEKFDGLHGYFTTGPYAYFPGDTIWANSWGWTLLSYLRLYETTGDQAYLIRFAEHASGLIAKKHTWTNIVYSGLPLWTVDLTDDQWLHYSSELTLPMTEYVNMVAQDPELQALAFSSAVQSSYLGAGTHGEFAVILAQEALETLQYLANYYWLTSEHGVCRHPVTSCERNCVEDDCIEQGYDGCFWCDCVIPEQMDRQADFAVAIYHLDAAIDLSQVSLDSKAHDIAEYFKLHLDEHLPTSSFVWYGAPEDNGANAWRLEDVAHGASVIQIPLTSIHLHGQQHFTQVDMSKFANTFARNIWNATGGYFQPNVHGALFGTSDGQGIINFFARAEVLCWMPLELYDLNEPPNDIYTLLTTQAELLLEDSPAALVEPGFTGNSAYLSGPQSYYGLSEVVKAQWRRECANLTLYNRDLVYDQNFAVKHVLTVDPTPPIGPDHLTPITASFADPIITDPHFTVREGITSQFRAGAAVVWQPGFEAEYGSHVEAVIDPAGCELVVHMGLQGSEAQAHEDKRARFPADAFARDQARLLAARVPPSPQTTMRLAPNPSVGLSTLEVSLHENAELRWDLFNGLGQRVASSSPMLLTTGTHALPMDAAGLAPGTYVLSVWVNGKPEQLRLVLTEQ